MADQSVIRTYTTGTARISGVINGQDSSKVHLLKTRVQECLAELRAVNNDSFSYNYPQMQFLEDMCFGITNGNLTTEDMKTIRKKFPGAKLENSLIKGSMSLLIPLSLASSQPVMGESDDSEDDDGTMALTKKKIFGGRRGVSRAKLYCELAFYILLLLAAIVLMVLYGRESAMAYISAFF